jgi:hypothetical protein
MTLDEIVNKLNERKQRATYGAVAGVVGGLARGLMNGRPKCHKYSWVVSKSGPNRGSPTGYARHDIHPDCLWQIHTDIDNVIDDAEALREWLKAPR